MKIKGYAKIIGIIYLCVFSALLITLAYNHTAGFLFSTKGFINLFDYLWVGVRGSSIYTGIICLAFLLYKVCFKILLRVMTGPSPRVEDDSFVYTVDNNTDTEELSG